MANKDGTESVKLSSELVRKVRQHKGETGIPITTFIEKATEEKLKKSKQSK